MANAWTSQAVATAIRQRLPVVMILLGIGILWYAAAVYLNAPRVIAEIESKGTAGSLSEVVDLSWSMKRPVVPAPHQILEDLATGVFGQSVFSPRSLLFHAAVTLQSAVLGFTLALALGIGLAILIVHIKFFDHALFPWVVASQAVPIIATAPMIIVVLGYLGFDHLVAKALIAALSAFFPIAISMVVGQRSADPLQLELLRTYSADRLQVFTKLRWPSAMTFLLPSLKVAATLAIVGAIVGELPTGAQAGLGARLLIASYNGLIVMMWSVLVMSAVLAVTCVAAIGAMERLVRLKRGGRL